MATQKVMRDDGLHCGQCDARVDEAARYCPSCGNDLRSDATTMGAAPRSDGQPASTPLSGLTTTPSQPVKRRTAAVNAGWLCFVIGMVLLFAHIGTTLLSIPLFVASLVLGIVGIAQGRTASGVVLLCMSVAAPLVLVPGVVCARVGQSMATQKEAERNALASVTIEDEEWYRDGDYFRTKGTVRNRGTTTLNYIKVGATFYDKDNQVVDTDWTYAVSGEGLAPGEARSFDMMTRSNSRAKTMRCRIIIDE
jgi:hypothetical protein